MSVKSKPTVFHSKKYEKASCPKIFLTYCRCRWHRWITFYFEYFPHVPEQGVQGQVETWFVKRPEAENLVVRLPLKGQCHEIFCFRLFSWITFPQAPDNNFTIISNFFENSRRYSQVKVHHRCQRHQWQICHRYQRHRRQICQRYQRHRRQILPPVPLVLLTPVANLSTIPAANLPPVSTTPPANCHRYQRHRRQIGHRCH